MTKKIFILPSVTDLNRGDQALVWESINVVKDIYADASFYLFESGNSPEDTHLQTRQTVALGYKTVPRILKHPGRINRNKAKKSVRYSVGDYFLWGMQAVADLFVTSMLLIPFTPLNALGKVFLSEGQKNTLNEFKNCDAVFVKGGGFIHTYGKITDIYLIYFSLYYMLLAIRYKKKIIVLPNSIGPLNGFLPRQIIRFALKRCALVTVRENVSGECVKKEINLETCLFPDLGFYLQPSTNDFTDYLKSKGIPLGEKKIIGITLRPYRFPNSPDPKQRYESYVNELANFVEQLVESNLHIVFSAHTLGPSSHEDDRIALKDVMLKLSEKSKSNSTYLEDVELDCRDLTSIYSHFHVMVGTRFHSVIFALNVEVPSVAIAYGGNKSFGIMKDLGLDDFVFPIEEVKASDLFISVQKIIHDKDNYVDKIRSHREQLNKDRNTLIELISTKL